MTLGERIRELRKGQGWRLVDLKARADVSLPYLSDIENDKVNPSMDMIIRLADAFKMTATMLLDPINRIATEDTIVERYLEGDSDFGEQLNADWIATLHRIEYKGQRLQTRRQWLEAFYFLQRLLAPEEIGEE